MGGGSVWPDSTVVDAWHANLCSRMDKVAKQTHPHFGCKSTQLRWQHEAKCCFVPISFH